MIMKNSVRNTPPIELTVPPELIDYCSEIRRSLNLLESRLKTYFPNVESVTDIPHENLQEALQSYYERISKEVFKEMIDKSGITPASEHPYALKVPNFVEFLQSKGKTGIGKVFRLSNQKERLSVFLKDVPIGILDFLKNPSEVHYNGYVPGIYYEENKIYDFGTIPGFSYVRMICTNPENEERKREDNWKIPFP